MRTHRASVVAVALLISTALAGCTGSPSGDASTPATSGASERPSPSASESPKPTATPTSKPVAIPEDCRAILSDDVLAQLEDVPLNDPAVGPTGIQPGGSLLCIWRDPRADTTALITTISHMNRGPALGMLNVLADDEGFTCFTPDEGTRCEKTWENEVYPVTDGRTLFWRDGVMIDTSYSNLAPSGYTSSIVASLFE